MIIFVFSSLLSLLSSLPLFSFYRYFLFIIHYFQILLLMIIDGDIFFFTLPLDYWYFQLWVITDRWLDIIIFIFFFIITFYFFIIFIILLYRDYRLLLIIFIDIIFSYFSFFTERWFSLDDFHYYFHLYYYFSLFSFLFDDFHIYCFQ